MVIASPLIIYDELVKKRILSRKHTLHSFMAALSQEQATLALVGAGCRQRAQKKNLILNLLSQRLGGGL
jgi:hypothetical protein